MSKEQPAQANKQPVYPPYNHRKFQIEIHDSPLYQNKPLKNNGFFLPLLKGSFIHLVILIAVIYGGLLATNIKPPPAIETSLVSPEDLANIQSQIEGNRLAASQASIAASKLVATDGKQVPTQQSSNQQASNKTTENNSLASQQQQAEALQGQTNTSSELTSQASTDQVPTDNDQLMDMFENTMDTDAMADYFGDTQALPMEEEIEREIVPVIVPSKEAIEAQAQYSERKRRYEENIQRFIEQEEQKISGAKEKTALRENLSEQSDEQAVDALKQAESEESNTPDTDNPEKLMPESNTEKITTMSMEDTPAQKYNNTLSSNNLTRNNSGMPAANQGGRKIKSTNLPAVTTKIKSYLNAPINSGKDVTQIRIVVNSQGLVIRANATGKNEYLNRAIEKAARAASPLPITREDKHYPSFTAIFNGTGNQ